MQIGLVQSAKASVRYPLLDFSFRRKQSQLIFDHTSNRHASNLTLRIVSEYIKDIFRPTKIRREWNIGISDSEGCSDSDSD